MISKLHHVAILTANIEEAIAFYADLLGLETRPVIQVDRPDAKFHSVMLPLGTAGQTHLQIIEPCIGPGVGELAKGGEGVLFEMGIQVDDIEAFHRQLADQGISPVDIAGVEIEGKFVESKYGNRYFFLPRDKTRGARIEIVQIMSG